MSTIAQKLDAAVKLHQAGRLDEAEQRYQEILRIDACQADAWHLLGLIAHARGQSDVALRHLQRAIELDDRQPIFFYHLAEAQRARGDWAAAERACLASLSRREDFALAHHSLAMVRHQQGDSQSAIAGFRRALQLDPKLAPAHCHLATVLEECGQRAQAIASFERAIELDPQDSEALCGLGNIWHIEGRLDRAELFYRRAVAIEPHAWAADFNLGLVLQQRGQTDGAIAAYRRALQQNPDDPRTLNNLGTLLKKQDDLPGAKQCFERALEFQPNFAEALMNLGNVFKSLGRFNEAWVCGEHAVRMQPQNPQARYNRALLQLAVGRWEDGWSEYEWRWKCPDFPRRDFAAPRWQGQSLPGGRLLVHAEQGLGDTLQFIRYLPRLRGRLPDSEITFAAPRKLLPLLQCAAWASRICWAADDEPLAGFDAHIPLMSLPGIFQTTLETIPSQVPYLSADPARTARWLPTLAAIGGLKVGIAWQGSRTYQGDRFRSIPLTWFARLARPGVTLISLQQGAGCEQIAALAAPRAVHCFAEPVDVHDPGHRAGLQCEEGQQHGAFMDTAAIITQLDLVITSDTSIAHLAGALGAEVWVALPVAADWRWLREGDTSPWYPTMRLFRQTRFDDWQPVFAEIAAALTARCPE